MSSATRSATARGKAKSFQIERGTPLEDAVEALGIIGFDADAAKSLTQASDIAKARHADRHPMTGRFQTSSARRLFTKHGGATLPVLLRD